MFLDQFSTLGGGQRVLLGLVRRGIEQGRDIAVALPPGAVAERAAEMGARVFPLALPVLAQGRKSLGDAVRYVAGAPRLQARLVSSVRQFQPDVIHVNGARLLGAAVFAAGGVPLVFHAHTVHVDALTAVTVRRLLRAKAVRRVVCPSEFMAGWVGEELGVAWERCAVVRNWVEEEFFERGRQARRDEHRHDPVVALVGRVTPDKGQLDAVQALISLQGCGFPIQLVIAGDRDLGYAEKVQAAAATLDPPLEMVGRIGDVAALLARSDVALVPSVWDEPFGLAAAEAMALGIPVVAYASGALPEVVGDAGLLVPRGDVSRLAENLRAVLEDARLWAELSGAGRARARALFDYVRQTDAVFDLFEEVARDYRS